MRQPTSVFAVIDSVKYTKRTTFFRPYCTEHITHALAVHTESHPTKIKVLVR
jgi:hypothetical protein